MAKEPSFPHDLRSDFAARVLQFPTRRVILPADAPARPGSRLALTRKVQTRRRVIREVVVLEPAGRLSDVVEDLDLAIQLALAEEPRGVVCDLSAVLAEVEQVDVEVLATAGRHARNWPGTPVAVACADPALRMVLAAHPLGSHLIVSPSLFSAISEVLAAPAAVVELLPLAPHPTAPRASRDFVTRVMGEWGLESVIPSAALVVSELAASSARNVGTDMELSVGWNVGAVRLALRDHGPVQLLARHAAVDALTAPDALELNGRGMDIIAGLSRAFGFLPAADGGQFAWAVLEAPRSRTWARRARAGRAAGKRGSMVFADAHVLPKPSLSAVPTPELSRAQLRGRPAPGQPGPSSHRRGAQR